MKAGTAQKLILNMITTGAMIRSGKVYSNLMVDVEATNAKLVQRQVNIVVEATECSPEEAEEALNQCQRHCKTAIVMILGGLSAPEASAVLSNNKGFIRQALQGIQA
jgi:N-acetylmuramic acid 6-phosphate etherase